MYVVFFVCFFQIDFQFRTKKKRDNFVLLKSTQNSTTGGNERGCATTTSSYSECMHNTNTCKLCIAGDTSACNVNEFPEDRRKCVQCDTSNRKCPTQQSPELVGQYSAYCRNATDSCAIINRGGSNNFMQMCASEMDEATKQYCNEHQGQCTFCTGQHNCNLLNSDGSSTPPPPTTSTPATATVDPSNSTNEIVTKQPSSGHQLYGNRILLATTFTIISVTMMMMMA